MMIAMWRGTVLMLADISSPYHLEVIAERQVAWAANDEIRMAKLEGMTNGADCASLSFVLHASFVIHKMIVSRRVGPTLTIDNFAPVNSEMYLTYFLAAEGSCENFRAA